MLELINETPASVVEEETANTTEGLSSQELDFSVWLVGVNQTCGVDLNLLEIDGAGTDVHGELLSITSAVLSVGSGEIPVFGTMLLEEGVFSEVGSITTSGEDDGTVCGLGLALVLVLSTDNGARLVLDELADASLLQDLNTFRVADGKILKTLHLGVGDNLGKIPSEYNIGI